MNSFRSWLFRLFNAGVKQDYLPWEIALNRKLNKYQQSQFLILL